MTWLAITLGILAMLVILALIGWHQRHEDDRLRAKVARIMSEHQGDEYPPPPPASRDPGREIRDGGFAPKRPRPPREDVGGLERKGIGW